MITRIRALWKDLVENEYERMYASFNIWKKKSSSHDMFRKKRRSKWQMSLVLIRILLFNLYTYTKVHYEKKSDEKKKKISALVRSLNPSSSWKNHAFELTKHSQLNG